MQEREREQAARYRAARAVWEAACGNAAEGKRNAMAALQLSNRRDVQYAAGLVLAFSGGSSPSETLASDLDKRFPEDTAAEFQKILNHRGIVGSDPIGALVHLQLGRVFALSGDKVKAKIAYRDFFTLWESADSEIPILKQVNAEYAELPRQNRMTNLK